MKTIEIDGGFGEGGGQILRTALSLSCITGHNLKLINIRKERKRPGLMPQHTTCVEAAALISGAEVAGNEQGSVELSFNPHKIKSGRYTFDIQTAGSTSLVLQTLLPPLVYSGKLSHITIRGGTHVPFSPVYNYIAEVFLPVLEMAGIDVRASIVKCGYYPKGGGEVSFHINPAKKIAGLDLKDKGALLSLSGCSAVSRLPASIAERQKTSLIQHLDPLAPHIKVVEMPSFGTGTFVFIKSEYSNTLAGFSSLGERGKPAEEVGREAALQCMEFHKGRGCLDPHLADQIVLYLSLARDHSSFTTSRVTRHLITNLWVIEKFLNVRYEIDGDMNGEGCVKIIPGATSAL